MHNLPRVTAIAAVVWLLPALGHAEIKTEQVEYKQGDTVLQGFVAWDDSVKGKRPGILIVHEWWGLNEHAREQARRIAKAGYVGFALDMYGKGKVASHPQDAKTFSSEVRADPSKEKARVEAALAELKKRAQVNPKQLAILGYCFGGGVALDVARMGSPFALVATFHGALGSQVKAKPGIKPRILVLTGADDPMVDKAQVAAFKDEMTAAHAHFEVVEYPGAKHAFTNPDADKMGVPGLAYSAQADHDSWEALLKALHTVFGSK